MILSNQNANFRSAKSRNIEIHGWHLSRGISWLSLASASLLIACSRASNQPQTHIVQCSVIHDHGNSLSRHCDKGMAEGRVGSTWRRASTTRISLQISSRSRGIEYIQIHSKYIRIHLPRYD